jgi:hypothetical protein
MDDREGDMTDDAEHQNCRRNSGIGIGGGNNDPLGYRTESAPNDAERAVAWLDRASTALAALIELGIDV